MPKISVIVPNYNYAQYLPQRFESILNQSYQDFELIVIDDASDDNSQEIITDYANRDKRIKIILNKKNSGNPFIQWQKGIKQSKGEYIWIAEADDWCEVSFLEKLLPFFKENKDVVLVFSQSKIADNKGNIKTIWQTNNFNISFTSTQIFNGNIFIKDALIYENVIPNASAVLFRKSIYEKVGGVNSELKSNADWLLWLKMAVVGDIAFVADSLNYFRRHEKSVIFQVYQNKNDYRKQYDGTMRIFFQKYIKSRTINYSEEIKKQNSKYIAWDIGNKALWLIAQKKYFKAVPLLVQSTIQLKSFGFIRKALKIYS